MQIEECNLEVAGSASQSSICTHGTFFSFEKYVRILAYVILAYVSYISRSHFIVIALYYHRVVRL